MNFRIDFSTPFSCPQNWNFETNWLNLLGSIDILTVLSLPVHEHTMSTYLSNFFQQHFVVFSMSYSSVITWPTHQKHNCNPPPEKNSVQSVVGSETIPDIGYINNKILNLLRIFATLQNFLVNFQLRVGLPSCGQIFHFHICPLKDINCCFYVEGVCE